jgi:hypothetical protein
VLSYEASRARRDVEISYSSGEIGDRRGVVVQISDTTQQGKGMWLSDWLRAKGLERELTMNCAVDGDQSEEEFVNAFCSALERVCRGHLNDILNGSRWDPTPFDWIGYK